MIPIDFVCLIENVIHFANLLHDFLAGFSKGVSKHGIHSKKHWFVAKQEGI